MIYQYLQPAINVGLSEFDFWEMTKAEIERYLEGAVWREKQKAQHNYVLADLVGASVARIMSSDAKYPPIEEVYPSLFVKPEEVDVKKEDVNITDSVNRFLAFAKAHNAKIKKE